MPDEHLRDQREQADLPNRDKQNGEFGKSVNFEPQGGYPPKPNPTPAPPPPKRPSK